MNENTDKNKKSNPIAPKNKSKKKVETVKKTDKSNKAVVAANKNNDVKKHKVLKVKNKVRTVVRPSPIIVETKRVDSQNRKVFPWSLILILGIMLALLLFLVLSYVEVDSYSQDIAQLKNEITELKRKEAAVKVAVNKKDAALDIENYAENELGMKKSVITDWKFVDVNPEDATEIKAYEDDSRGTLGLLLATVGDMLNELIN